MSRRQIDLDALRGALIERLEMLVENLLGPRNRTHSSRREWRFGSFKASLSVKITGPDRGAWFDHGPDQGGGPLQLIQYVRRCTLSEAIGWALSFTGLATTSERAGEEERRKRLAQQAADRDAQAAADRTRRISEAQRLASESIPVAGTVAEQYLIETRGIPRPLGGWPDMVRFHPGTHVLLVVATTQDGAVQAVQRVHLTAEAQKAEATPERPTKRTNGVLDGAAVRLPGPTTGPLLVAEGPETGLSVWAATGHQTWVALGGLGKLALPPGRRICACRDDDRLHSPADKAFGRALERWADAGHAVVVATPWPTRRHDGSDFNDLIQACGSEAVRARIKAALNPGPEPPHRVPLHEAETTLEQVIADFFTEAIRHKPEADDAAPFAHVVHVDVGGGKSTRGLTRAARTLGAMRTHGDKGSIGIAIPTHRLSDQQAADFHTLPEVASSGLTARIWRGREAADPDAPDYHDPTVPPEKKQRMCRHLDLISEARSLKLPIDQAACNVCPFGPNGDGSCAYLAQAKARADLWLFAHQLLFEKKPAAFGDLAALIVDENPLDGAFIGINAAHPIRLPLATLERKDKVSKDDPFGETAKRLRDLRQSARSVLDTLEPGPVPQEAFKKARFTADMAHHAVALEWRTLITPKFSIQQTKEQRKAALELAAINADLGRRISLWNSLAELLSDSGPMLSGRLGLVEEGDGSRSLELKGLADVKTGWHVPTLVTDATADIRLLRHLWPQAKMRASIRVQAPHQRIRQVIDRSFALSALDVGGAKDEKEAAHRQRNLVRLHATICREARRFGSDKVLVVAQKRIREALVALGLIPTNVEWVHHNAARGLNDWRDVRAEIIIGRTLPSSEAIRRMAEALTGTALPDLAYERAEVWRELADGTMQRAEGIRCNEPIGEAMRWQACEGELLQLIGRARGVRRTEADPVDVLLLTDLALPVPIAETATAADLEPTPTDRMLAKGGVALANPAHASAAYPELWASREAAKKAFQRGKLGTNPYSKVYIRECPQLLRARYLLRGQGHSPAEAWFDPALVPDVAQWLSERLGQLAFCELVEPPEPDPPPWRPPRSEPPDDTEECHDPPEPVPDWAEEAIPVDAYADASDVPEPWAAAAMPVFARPPPAGAAFRMPAACSVAGWMRPEMSAWALGP